MADPQPDTARAPSLSSLGLAGDRPLLIVDVDEVLGLFVRGFGRFAEARGLEFRLEQFSLFKSLYSPGAAKPVDPAKARSLLAHFFRTGCGAIEPAPGAAEALRRLSRRAGVVALSNAPADARAARARWLGRHGMDYPLILGDGPKGPLAAALARQANAPAVFVDDLLLHLDSVAEAAPEIRRFQHVADPRLRPLAPSTPERHPRIDDWLQLREAIEAAIGA